MCRVTLQLGRKDTLFSLSFPALTDGSGLDLFRLFAWGIPHLTRRREREIVAEEEEEEGERPFGREGEEDRPFFSLQWLARGEGKEEEEEEEEEEEATTTTKSELLLVHGPPPLSSLFPPSVFC